MTFSRIFSSLPLLGAGIVLSLLLAVTAQAAVNHQYQKADLIITAIDDEVRSAQGYIDFRITTKNQGTDASRSSWVGIYVGSSFRRACVIPTLQVDQSTTVKCRFYKNKNENFSAINPLTFIVDDMEEIWESNENNNTATFDIISSRASLPTPQTVISAPAPINQAPIYIPNTSPVYIPTNTNIVHQNVIPQNFGETVGQYITCHFLDGGQGKKKCTAKGTNVKTQVLFCTNTLCRLKVSAPFGTTASVQSSCGSAQSVNIDGLNKNITFSCPVISNPGTLISSNTNTSFPLLPIKHYSGLDITNFQEGTTTGTLTFGDKYTLGFNGGIIGNDGIITIKKGETIDLGIAFEDIDENQTNYVYKKIPNNFYIEEVIFPESVECRTRKYSDFSTIFCRGQEPFSEIIYRLTAVKTGSSEIYAKIRYSDDDEKVLDKGYIPFIITQ